MVALAAHVPYHGAVPVLARADGLVQRHCERGAGWESGGRRRGVTALARPGDRDRHRGCAASRCDGRTLARDGLEGDPQGSLEVSRRGHAPLLERVELV